MVKNVYLCELLVLLCALFGFNSVQGDIIDSARDISEENVLVNNVDADENTKALNQVYGRLPMDCESPILCSFSHDVWFDIVDSERLISVFLVCLLLLMILSVFPLYRVFEKLGQKGWKTLVPVKNLYCLVDLLKIRKIGVIWGVLVILWIFIVSLFLYSLPPCFTICDFDGGCSRGDDVICGFHNLCSMFFWIPVIVVLLIYDYFVFVLFYRLFRKFGWNKGYAVLGTILFPIGTCVLGFGNFEYQGENLEKNGVNN